MAFVGHANQEVLSTRRTNIAMSLPKELYPLAKDALIPSEWLFGDDIDAMINYTKLNKNLSIQGVKRLT